MDVTESRCFDCWSRWNGSFVRLYSAGRGLEVVLQDTNLEHVEAIQRDGLQIKGFGGDRNVQITAISDPGQIQSADLLLFQCKGNASREAAQGSNI